jgi:transposase
METLGKLHAEAESRGEQVKKIVVFMDNATIHCSLLLKKSMLRTGHILLFNTPYTPETNPIEYLFGHLKRNLRTEPLTTQ